jgi:hypothetical protein
MESMASARVRKPRLMAAVWLAVALAGWVSVAWGTFEMHRLDRETGATAAAIGVGFPVAVIATGMLFLAIRTIRIVAALDRGEGVIARWIVPPDDFAEFAADNAARNALGGAYRNDWKVPRTIPPQGIEIVFGADGVFVGNSYFGLVNTGMLKFEGVQMLPGNPLALEFGTVATTISHGTSVRVNRTRGALRIPVSRLARAGAIRVLDHFRRVDAREIVVNPGFYLGRMRFGLIAAPTCFLLAAAGFALQFLGYGNLLDGILPVALAVGGTVAGIGALVLSWLAWTLSRAQHHRRR